MDIFSVSANKEYKIIGFEIEDKLLERRLNEFGIVVGNSISILSFSPKKKTVLVNLLGTAVALKSEIAQHIMVGNV